jgi:solute carrier family 35 protein E1
MVKLTNLILVLGSGLVVTAFSLERGLNTQNRLNSNSAISTLKKPSIASKQSVRVPTHLLSAEGNADLVGSAGKAPEAKSSGFIDKIWNENTKLFFYLSVWYLGNIYYNIYNKKACNALGKNLAGGTNGIWALSAFQLLVGVLFVLPLWLTGIRPAPKMTAENWKELSPVGLWAALAHAFSVLSLSAGAVSFGQIVKAGEPVFAALTNAVLLKEIDHPMVYLTLLPIIGGVGLASLKELSFTWTALIAASAANQAAAFKNVVSKGIMGKSWAKALGPQNFYAVVTLLAMIATLPFVAVFDVKDAATIYNSVIKAGKGAEVAKYSLLSGLAFYLYNEASFLALDRLNPVSHSVANTLKRVVIIVASCIVFNTPITTLGSIGSAIAILGTLLYSLAKKNYKKH